MKKTSSVRAFYDHGAPSIDNYSKGGPEKKRKKPSKSASQREYCEHRSLNVARRVNDQLRASGMNHEVRLADMIPIAQYAVRTQIIFKRFVIKHLNQHFDEVEFFRDVSVMAISHRNAAYVAMVEVRRLLAMDNDYVHRSQLQRGAIYCHTATFAGYSLTGHQLVSSDSIAFRPEVLVPMGRTNP